MADAREKKFQSDIVDALVKQGWVAGTADKYNREYALYPEDCLAFMKGAFPDQWDKLCIKYSEDTERYFIRSVSKQLDKKGTLSVLRKGFKDRGAQIQLCRFMPDHGLNPQTVQQYSKNILRVVPEVTYSPHGYGGRLDLVLFVNGIPVATLELKSDFKQPIENAITQYKKDRPHIDPATRRLEPLFAFGKRALVHFAVTQSDVAMCTKLLGPDSFFLPFNQGTLEGGKGNPQPKKGYATSYLWNEVMQPDNWLRILGRFLHLERKEKERWDGTKYTHETLIFPRFHQWAAVTKLIDTARDEGTGHKYLIQHSAGSGKSNSIAWTAHQLASLRNEQDQKIFNSVIVVTDRTVLDAQLQETIGQFEHASGVVCCINRDKGGAKSNQLADALESNTPIIIVTIQTFPFVLEMLQQRTTLQGRGYAIIADEAHSSQTGNTARQLREVLSVEEKEDDDEFSVEEKLDALVESRKTSKNISYFAFTATPKAKTLETFGRLPKPALPPSKTNLPEAFHVYTMRQAIEEGFILDVLRNYTTYNMACKLGLQNGTGEEEIDAKKGATTLAKWVRLHPHNISQKVQVILEHFRKNVAPLLNQQAKAMVVTDSRKAAVRYKLAFDKYVAENRDICGNISAMVAFSGEVIDHENAPEPFTETSMNPGLNGRDMREAFDTDEYQVMIVANKFQTGFDQPKLCAMYVDKKLGGVDAVQTLSRLNRTYAGKDTTFVLDFVNDPADILKAFKPFYKTAELADVSDPNLAADLKDKLDEQHIYYWDEVEAFVEAFFDPKSTQDVLLRHCRPAVDRFKARYIEAMDVIRKAQQAVQHAKQSGDDVAIKNADFSLKEALKAKDVLDTFKKDLASFIRFYEFSSQIIDYGDREFESLTIYARHLINLLRDEQLHEEIDLSDVVMTHYRLSKQRVRELQLSEGEDVPLLPTDAIGTRTAKDRKKEALADLIEKMNAIFAGDFTEGDLLNYARTIMDKVGEDQRVVEQIANNTPEVAMKGDLPNVVQKAVIDSMGIHKDLAMQVLSNEQVRRSFVRVLLEMLCEGPKEAV